MTIDELQALIKAFVDERGIGTSVEHRILDLHAEAGELAKEALKNMDYGKSQFDSSKKFEKEFSDVLFSLVCLANQTGIDIEKNIKEALVEYDIKFKDHKHIGSLNKK